MEVSFLFFSFLFFSFLFFFFFNLFFVLFYSYLFSHRIYPSRVKTGIEPGPEPKFKERFSVSVAELLDECPDLYEETAGIRVQVPIFDERLQKT